MECGVKVEIEEVELLATLEEGAAGEEEMN